MDLNVSNVTKFKEFIANPKNFETLLQKVKQFPPNMFEMKLGVYTFYKINLTTYEKTLFKSSDAYINLWVKNGNEGILDDLFQRVFSTIPEMYFEK